MTLNKIADPCRKLVKKMIIQFRFRGPETSTCHWSGRNAASEHLAFVYRADFAPRTGTSGWGALWWIQGVQRTKRHDTGANRFFRGRFTNVFLSVYLLHRIKYTTTKYTRSQVRKKSEQTLSKNLSVQFLQARHHKFVYWHA
jgi:hypothetical protein